MDAALAKLLKSPGLEEVYLSPWWEVTVDRAEAFGWKRAVLRRNPGAGATHWGHLFLLVRGVGTRARLSTADGAGPGGTLPIVEVAAYETQGSLVHLWARARAPVEMEALCAALAAQLSPTASLS
ncbi:MAG: hypothetical protein L3K13_06530 [Thermoplasmata archaeon]|nr:hypothetical protein [Thermoplasmata archaeon]